MGGLHRPFFNSNSANIAMNKIEIKRKHHYVWAHYLNSWEENGTLCNVFSLSKKTGRIVSDSTKGIACEQLFYKLNHFTDFDIQHFSSLINLTNIDIRELHREHFNSFTRILELTPQEKSKDPDLQHEIEAILCNTMENYHSSYESDFIKLHNTLLNHTPRQFTSDEHLSLANYIGQQITRTKNFKKKTLNSLATDSPYHQCYKNHWWFISHFFGVNISAEIFFNRNTYNFELLIANENHRFITSDQPVINISMHFQSEMMLYYPLSPQKALLISPKGTGAITETMVSEDEVASLNSKISLRADDRLFASQKEDLEEVRSIFLNTT